MNKLYNLHETEGNMTAILKGGRSNQMKQLCLDNMVSKTNGKLSKAIKSQLLPIEVRLLQVLFY